jgi:Leucine-rich repeat (LRR) protein
LSLFTKVVSLILDNNLITENFTLPLLPSLDALSVNNNNIADIHVFLNNIGLKKYFISNFYFFVVSSVPKLKYLSTLNNPGCPHRLIGVLIETIFLAFSF